MFAAKDTLLTRPSGGYVIPRSLRFRSSASAYLNRTFGTPTDSTKFTYSKWMKRGQLDTLNTIIRANSTDYIHFSSSATIQLVLSNVTQLTTTPVFRDPSAWGHFVVSYNNAASPKWNLYWNNLNIGTSTASNTTFDTAVSHGIGQDVSGGGGKTFDGYFAEINFVDGQALTPTSFGATSATTGVWAPIKYTGTYGANGFHLDFNSYATTAALGTDTSGNGNTWTVNNCSVTAGATYDSMIDVPTVGTTGSNYCVWNPVSGLGGTFSDGNLKSATGTSTQPTLGTFQLPITGKWYWEVTVDTVAEMSIGINTLPFSSSTRTVYYRAGGASAGIYIEGTANAFAAASYTNADVISVAYNADASQITWYKNNTQQGGPFTLTSLANLFPYLIQTSGAGSCTGVVNFGQQGFKYTPPTGYSALNTYNLPTPSILIGAAHMAATTYTGTGASLTVANTVNSTSFQPDLVWVKGRTAITGATDHAWYDSVRGVQKQLESNTTTAETTETTGLTAFGSTGFTVGALAQMNTITTAYIGWQWKGSGTTVSNTSGTITSTVCVNPTAGFSVLTYTGVGATRTIGHSLGVAPAMVITKNKSSATSWRIYHAFSNATPQNYVLYFDTSAATAETAFMNNTAPTSAVFTAGTNICAAADYVSYCFAPIAGYSAFGSYTGNGSTDGPFVFTGFRPRCVLFKSSSSVNNWQIYDTSRNTSNATTNWIYPDVANAEATSGVDIDILSNGFKPRSTNAINNGSGVTYIYAAFAESPFKNSLAR